MTEGATAPPTTPFERILVGTDLSTHGRKAALRVARLPLAQRARIVLAHVAPGGIDVKMNKLVEKGVRDQLRALVAEMKRAATRSGVTIDVEPFLTEGRIADELVDRAERDGSELIVVGRHGGRTFKDLLIGSVARRVVHAAHTPVLVVSGGAAARYRRPFVAVDLSERTEGVVALAHRITPDTHLVVGHVYERPYDALFNRIGAPEAKRVEYDEACREQAEAHLHTIPSWSSVRDDVELVLKAGDPRKVITSELQKRKSDLLIVGAHQRTGLAGAFVGSTADGMVAAAPCDVLVRHDDQA